MAPTTRTRKPTANSSSKGTSRASKAAEPKPVERFTADDDEDLMRLLALPAPKHTPRFEVVTDKHASLAARLEALKGIPKEEKIVVTDQCIKKMQRVVELVKQQDVLQKQVGAMEEELLALINSLINDKCAKGGRSGGGKGKGCGKKGAKC